MKVGIVIQGRASNLFLLQKNIEMILKYFNKEDILISTWEESGKLRAEQDAFCDDDGNLFGIDTLRTKANFARFGNSFDAVNVDNIVVHALSTNNGLNHNKFSDYDYLIKIRTDEFYDRLDLFKDAITSDNRIHCGSLFFRNDFPFHIGDHIVGGKKQELIELFGGVVMYAWDLLADAGGQKFFQEIKDKKWNKVVFNNLEGDISKLIKFTYSDICPEVKFAVTYIFNKEKELPSVKNQVQLMNKYFVSYDVRKFENFYFSANSVGDGTIITQKNLSDSGDIVIDFKECREEHEEWLLCSSDEQNALLKILLQSETRDNSYLKDLNDDFTIYCSLYNPVRIHEDYRDRTRIQNFRM